MNTVRLRARNWYRYVVYGQFVVVPCVVLTGLGFVGLIHWGWAVAGFAVLSGFGLSGAVLQILMMLRKVQFVYKASDMDSWLLRFGHKLDSEYGGRGVILEDDDDTP